MHVQLEAWEAVVRPRETEVLEELLDLSGDDVGSKTQHHHTVPEAAKAVQMAPTSTLEKEIQNKFVYVITSRITKRG